MAEVWGWGAFFGEIVSFLRQIRMENSSQNHLEFYLERLEIIISSTRRIRDVLHSSQVRGADEAAILLHYQRLIDELHMHLNEVYTEVDSALDNYMSNPATAYRADTIENGRRGRPRFDITSNQLTYLASLSFTWIQIARMLGISRMTLYRRRAEFGMLRQVGRTVRDNELLRLMREMRSEFPEMGEVMVLGRLRALGYSVVRDRVRRAIRETDPINTALRATTGPLARRVYSVPGPNSLWHVGKFMHSCTEGCLPGVVAIFGKWLP